MATPKPDDRTPDRRALDEAIASESPLSPLDTPAGTTPVPMESHLRKTRRPVAVAGVVENGLVRPLDPTVRLPEHVRRHYRRKRASVEPIARPEGPLSLGPGQRPGVPSAAAQPHLIFTSPLEGEVGEALRAGWGVALHHSSRLTPHPAAKRRRPPPQGGRSETPRFARRECNRLFGAGLRERGPSARKRIIPSPPPSRGPSSRGFSGARASRPLRVNRRGGICVSKCVAQWMNLFAFGRAAGETPALQNRRGPSSRGCGGRGGGGGTGVRRRRTRRPEARRPGSEGGRKRWESPTSARHSIGDSSVRRTGSSQPRVKPWVGQRHRFQSEGLGEPLAALQAARFLHPFPRAAALG